MKLQMGDELSEGSSISDMANPKLMKENHDSTKNKYKEERKKKMKKFSSSGSASKHFSSY